MKSNLEQNIRVIQHAQRPEDVFGNLGGHPDLAGLRKSYHVIAKQIHPDLYSQPDEKTVATHAFEMLNDWLKQAETRLWFGIYDQSAGGPGQLFLQSRRHLYCLEDRPVREVYANVYPCRFEENGKIRIAAARIIREPRHNNFAAKEIEALHRLRSVPDASKYSAYLPVLLDEFIFQDENGEHQVTVVEREEGWYSLEDVRKVYPMGVDPRHMAWMFRRLLVVVGFAHRSGVMHASVTPENILILPAEHGLLLANWSNSVCELPDPAYDPRLDIAQAVRSMLFLLGGDVNENRIPDDLPARLKNFFKGSLLPINRAPRDAWGLLREFDEVLERTWGKRKFYPFVM